MSDSSEYNWIPEPNLGINKNIKKRSWRILSDRHAVELNFRF